MHKVFETERLLVRRYTESDLDVFFHLNNDADVVRYIRAPKSREESLHFLKENIAFYDFFPYMGRWAMEEKESGRVVGTFAVIPVEHSHEVQIGYSLLKEHWGKGYATESVPAGRQYAFDSLCLPHVLAITEAANTASQKVLVKCGFTQNSIRRDGDKELRYFISNNPDHIETERLRIFPLTAEQLSLYLEGGDKLEKQLSLTVTGRTVAPAVRDAVRRVALPIMQSAAARSWLFYTFWLIVHKDSKTIVAEIGFKGLPDKQKAVEIGYGTMPAYEGRGYMTEAVGGIIQWASQRPDIEAVLAEANRLNKASIRVLEKNGFQHFDTRGEMWWFMKEV